jgi:hypothetical protein
MIGVISSIEVLSVVRRASPKKFCSEKSSLASLSREVYWYDVRVFAVESFTR